MGASVSTLPLTAHAHPTWPNARHTGTLAVSRSLGDFTYKATAENRHSPSRDLLAATRPGAAVTGDLVSNKPHIATCALHAQHTPFLVLFSDGIFARLSDQDVVDTVSHLRYAKHLSAEAIARHLVAMVGGGSRGADNCTCIVLFFG
jgi:serine/threonine protein phosphatase PrpC